MYSLWELYVPIVELEPIALVLLVTFPPRVQENVALNGLVVLYNMYIN